MRTLITGDGTCVMETIWRLLPSGLVLVAGGTGGGSLSSAELYNPATGSWSATGSMSTARQVHTATLLPSGVVLVAGGVMSGGGRTSSVEVYNPTTGNWSSDASLIVARDSSTATLLPNGKVLVAAGQSGPLVPTGSAELFACVATPCPTGA